MGIVWLYVIIGVVGIGIMLRIGNVVQELEKISQALTKRQSQG